jgi:LysM domain-containing protein
MFSNQASNASRATAGCVGLAVLLALGGCAIWHHGSETAPAEAAPAPVAASGEAASEPQTVTEALGDVGADTDMTTTVMPDAGPALKPSAPKDYVVRRGDTLWGIANMFLRDPWLWPEIWYVNPGIQNPHRIYPGDTVHLALASDGRTSLQVVRGSGLSGSRLEPMLRSSPLESAIPTIPYAVIAAFLERPGVLSRDEVKSAPYILALRGEHDIAGTGDDVYVKKLDSQSIAGARYSVMHVDEPLNDPDGGRKLGYLAIYTGTAQLTRPGPIAKATMTDAQRETLQGDVLISEDAVVTSDFKPHPPAKPVSGEIIAVVAGDESAGQYDVVALNRGSSDGLERGNVLTAEEVTVVSDDQCARIQDRSTCLFHPNRTLPTEASGTLLVFKTYEQMSYALILVDTVPIHTYEHVRNP